MKRGEKVLIIAGVLVLLFFCQGISGSYWHLEKSNSDQTNPQSEQTKKRDQQTGTTTKTTDTKPQQVNSKSKQTTSASKAISSKPKPTVTKSKSAGLKPTQQSSKTTTKKNPPVSGTVTIGTQIWAETNLNVVTFRNGDTIPEAKTNQEWVAAGEALKPAWCYYNNDPATGQKYGKLYNWYAVNDPRELAPEGWSLSSDEDWAKLVYYLGGTGSAGIKLKSTSGWKDADNGTNDSGFTGLPGGYRVENGTFVNAGTIGIWWSTTESRTQSAIDYYLFMSSGIGRSNNPKQRGESVRCIRK